MDAAFDALRLLHPRDRLWRHQESPPRSAARGPRRAQASASAWSEGGEMGGLTVQGDGVDVGFTAASP